jgi:hypothetical protein
VVGTRCSCLASYPTGLLPCHMCWVCPKRAAVVVLQVRVEQRHEVRRCNPKQVVDSMTQAMMHHSTPKTAPAVAHFRAPSAPIIRVREICPALRPHGTPHAPMTVAPNHQTRPNCALRARLCRVRGQPHAALHLHQHRHDAAAGGQPAVATHSTAAPGCGEACSTAEPACARVSSW